MNTLTATVVQSPSPVVPAAAPVRVDISVSAPAAVPAPVAPKAAPATAAPTATMQQARELAAQMKQRAALVAPDLEFAVDKESGKALIKVIDRSTKQVVWQIPSEEMLQVTHALDRFQDGMMLRRTA